MTKTKQSSQLFLENLSKIVPLTLYSIHAGERSVKVSPQNLIALLKVLKQHTGREFSQLVDITSIDWPERKNRFEVVYSLLSISTSRRLRVSVAVHEGVSLPSVTSVYSSAGWFEREIYDRRGISFSGHPDLRPRLSDYGFRGHPLRKDFPLTGFIEVRYDERGKRLRYEPVSLPQEFRVFSVDAPW